MEKHYQKGLGPLTGAVSEPVWSLEELNQKVKGKIPFLFIGFGKRLARKSRIFFKPDSGLLGVIKGARGAPKISRGFLGKNPFLGPRTFFTRGFLADLTFGDNFVGKAHWANLRPNRLQTPLGGEIFWLPGISGLFGWNPFFSQALFGPGKGAKNYGT